MHRRNLILIATLVTAASNTFKITARFTLLLYGSDDGIGIGNTELIQLLDAVHYPFGSCIGSWDQQREFEQLRAISCLRKLTADILIEPQLRISPSTSRRSIRPARYEPLPDQPPRLEHPASTRDRSFSSTRYLALLYQYHHTSAVPCAAPAASRWWSVSC